MNDRRTPLAAASHELPIIDFATGTPETLARQFDDAFTGPGFCYVSGIGLDAGLVEGVFAASRRFHAQPREAKQAITMNRFHRGYMAAKTSIIETSTVARVTRPNDSESFMLMHEVAADDPRYGRPLDGPNQWPDMADFRPAVEAYDRAMHAFCLRLLPVLALALNLPRDWFTSYFQQPTTFLRLLHYPPQPPNPAPNEKGCGAHTDWGGITVLLQDSAGGLQVQHADGSWIAALPIAGTFVVNIGDLFARWTNNLYRSTVHRVINKSGRDRYSVPFFLDGRSDHMVSCIPGCAGDKRLFADTTVRGHLEEMVRRTYAAAG